MSTPESPAALPVENTRRERFPLYQQILVAMVVGFVAGPLLGKSAAPFGELGKVVIQLIKAVATPLIFLVIVTAVLKTEIRLRAGLRLLGWATLNACAALAIGLTLSNFLQPGRHLGAIASAGSAAAYEGKKVDFVSAFSGVVPVSVVSPFAENLVLSVVLLALLFGFGLRRLRGEQASAGGDSVAAIERALSTLLRVTEIVLGWVIRLIPFAVFGVVTKAVGDHGFAPLKGLGAYVGVAVLGLLLHVALTYHVWLLLLLRRSPREFWREAKVPVAYALGANSSLATLPVTLQALDRLRVSKEASTLGACVGTNFNNDGIILYEGMAVLFVAQATGIDLTLSQQLLAAAACLVAAMGVAGVPEAGFISLALVLNTVGLPIELLPLLLTVDWIVARGRSAVNVLSDMMLSLLVDRGTERTLTSGTA
jgi:DAACS family dicarboxylate/amino acid:cation (Na+ or H+) symporter